VIATCVKPTLAVIGGFLGAGKTTLILKAARMLAERGVHVAAVLNDQGDDLVDTELLRRHGIAADQVGGGCFCCRFPELIEALDRMAAGFSAGRGWQAKAPAPLIFAEAVGSCTDIVATTLRPLLRDHGHRFRVAPLTVLVHETPEEPDLRFLFDHQVAEADLVIDRGVDVAAWIDELLRDGVAAGTRSISVDYARYAEAEAALGWLNARVTVRPRPAVPPAMVVGPLVEEIDTATAAAGIRIVHLKVLAQCGSGYVKAGLTANGREPTVEGALDASPAAEHDVLINLRALGAPERLREIVEQALGRAECVRMEAFRPAAPVPFHRGASNSADTAPAGSSITQ
jgi:hypothetical protein